MPCADAGYRHLPGESCQLSGSSGAAYWGTGVFWNCQNIPGPVDHVITPVDNSGPGGGAGGNGPDPCTTVAGNPGEVGIIDEFGCNTGVPTETIIPTRNNHCEKTKAMLENPEVADKIDVLKQKAELPKANEFGFKVRPDGTTSALIEDEKEKIDFGDMHGFTIFYHSHPGVLGINVFSPPDIQSLFKAIITAGNSSNFKDISFGVIGSESCSSCPGGVKYFHYLIRYNGQFSDTGTIASTDYDMDAMEEWYQRKEKSLSSKSIYSDDGGNSLNNKGAEKLFFDTLDKMNINKNNMILQRIDDGTVYNITANSDGTTTATPCP